MNPKIPCPSCHFEELEGEQRFCPMCRFPLMLLSGKYRLVRKLGAGGMGEVFLAHHMGLQRDFERVVKIINPEVLEPAGLGARFQREVEVTSMLSRRNQHIVQIYDDFGQESGLGYFYVMEYLRGQTLDELQRARGLLERSLVFHLFAQLCQGVGAAHREGVVHRDLKPGNIFLTRRGDDPFFLKMIDFGLTKYFQGTGGGDSLVTQGGVGTPAYMSPEQCQNLAVDGRTDIYSMGILLYEMLTGEMPFDWSQVPSPSVGAILMHVMQAPIPMQSRAPDIPLQEGLDRVVLKALEKDPANRYPTAEAFWSALEPFAREASGACSVSEVGEWRTATRPPAGSSLVSDQPLLTPHRGVASSQPSRVENESYVLPSAVTVRASDPVNSQAVLEASQSSWAQANRDLTVPSRVPESLKDASFEPASRTSLWLVGLAGFGLASLLFLVVGLLFWGKRLWQPAKRFTRGRVASPGKKRALPFLRLRAKPSRRAVALAPTKRLVLMPRNSKRTLSKAAKSLGNARKQKASGVKRSLSRSGSARVDVVRRRTMRSKFRKRQPSPRRRALRREKSERASQKRANVLEPRRRRRMVREGWARKARTARRALERRRRIRKKRRSIQKRRRKAVGQAQGTWSQRAAYHRRVIAMYSARKRPEAMPSVIRSYDSLNRAYEAMGKSDRFRRPWYHRTVYFYERMQRVLGSATTRSFRHIAARAAYYKALTHLRRFHRLPAYHTNPYTHFGRLGSLSSSLRRLSREFKKVERYNSVRWTICAEVQRGKAHVHLVQRIKKNMLPTTSPRWSARTLNRWRDRVFDKQEAAMREAERIFRGALRLVQRHRVRHRCARMARMALRYRLK